MNPPDDQIPGPSKETSNTQVFILTPEVVSKLGLANLSPAIVTASQTQSVIQSTSSVIKENKIEEYDIPSTSTSSNNNIENDDFKNSLKQKLSTFTNSISPSKSISMKRKDEEVALTPVPSVPNNKRRRARIFISDPQEKIIEEKIVTTNSAENSKSIESLTKVSETSIPTPVIIRNKRRPRAKIIISDEDVKNQSLITNIVPSCKQVEEEASLRTLVDSKRKKEVIENSKNKGSKIFSESIDTTASSCLSQQISSKLQKKEQVHENDKLSEQVKSAEHCDTKSLASVKEMQTSYAHDKVKKKMESNESKAEDKTIKVDSLEKDSANNQEQSDFMLTDLLSSFLHGYDSNQEEPSPERKISDEEITLVSLLNPITKTITAIKEPNAKELNSRECKETVQNNEINPSEKKDIAYLDENTEKRSGGGSYRMSQTVAKNDGKRDAKCKVPKQPTKNVKDNLVAIDSESSTMNPIRSSDEIDAKIHSQPSSVPEKYIDPLNTLKTDIHLKKTSGNGKEEVPTDVQGSVRKRGRPKKQTLDTINKPSGSVIFKAIEEVLPLKRERRPKKFFDDNLNSRSNIKSHISSPASLTQGRQTTHKMKVDVSRSSSSSHLEITPMQTISPLLIDVPSNIESDKNNDTEVQKPRRGCKPKNSFIDISRTSKIMEPTDLMLNTTPTLDSGTSLDTSSNQNSKAKKRRGRKPKNYVADNLNSSFTVNTDNLEQVPSSTLPSLDSSSSETKLDDTVSTKRKKRKLKGNINLNLSPSDVEELIEHSPAVELKNSVTSKKRVSTIDTSRRKSSTSGSNVLQSFVDEVTNEKTQGCAGDDLIKLNAAKEVDKLAESSFEIKESDTKLLHKMTARVDTSEEDIQESNEHDSTRKRITNYKNKIVESLQSISKNQTNSLAKESLDPEHIIISKDNASVNSSVIDNGIKESVKSEKCDVVVAKENIKLGVSVSILNNKVSLKNNDLEANTSVFTGSECIEVQKTPRKLRQSQSSTHKNSEHAVIPSEKESEVNNFSPSSSTLSNELNTETLVKEENIEDCVPVSKEKGSDNGTNVKAEQTLSESQQSVEKNTNCSPVGQNQKKIAVSLIVESEESDQEMDMKLSMLASSFSADDSAMDLNISTDLNKSKKTESDLDIKMETGIVKKKVGRPPGSGRGRGKYNRKVLQPKAEKAGDGGGQKEMVKCAKCNAEVIKKIWNYHNLRIHNNLAWKEGDQPLDLNDEKLVGSILKDIYFKHKKAFHCETCDKTIKSVAGYQSHRSVCGKTKQEIEASLVKCEECESRVSPFAMYYHMETHRKAKLAEEASKALEASIVVETEPIENDSLLQDTPVKSRRKAAVKAADLWLQTIAEDDEEGEHSKTHKKSRKLYTVNMDFMKASIVPRAKVKMEIARCQSVKCKYENCTSTFQDVNKYLMHLNNCTARDDKIYTCIICLYTSNEEESVIYHCKVEHKPKNYEGCVEDSEESSSESSDSGDDESTNRIDNRKTRFRLKAKEVEFKHFNSNRVRFLPTIICKNSSTVFEPTYKWTLNMHLNFGEHELFPICHRMKKKWLCIKDPVAKQYLPRIDKSMKVVRLTVDKIDNIQSQQDFEWKNYNILESEINEDGSSTVFCGGPVRSMAWAPTPYSKTNADQILAVSCQRDPDDELYSTQPLVAPNVVQFWNYGPLDNNLSENRKPELEFCLAHFYGIVWAMEWCPSNCFTEKTESEEYCKRIGLLALGSSDGNVYIHVICPKEDLPPNPTKIYSSRAHFVLTPEKKYAFKSSSRKQAYRLSWSKANGHKYIAVGYTNGLVALFDLSISSPLLISKMIGNSVALLPYLTFQAHVGPVSALTLNHLNNGNRWLMTGSYDRRCKFWDLEDVSHPIANYRSFLITDGSWFTHWLSCALSFDESLSISNTASFLQNVRDFGSKRCSLMYADSDLNCTCSNDWSNSVVHGTRGGEVIGVFLSSVLSYNDVNKRSPKEALKTRRFLSSYTSLIEFNKSPEERLEEYNQKRDALKNVKIPQPPQEHVRLLDAKLFEDNPHYFEVEPTTYKEAAEKYGMVFCDFQLNSPKDVNEEMQNYLHDHSQMQPSAPHMFPLQSVSKVCCNPNKQAFSYLASGYEAGFVKVAYVKMWRGDDVNRAPPRASSAVATAVRCNDFTDSDVQISGSSHSCSRSSFSPQRARFKRPPPKADIAFAKIAKRLDVPSTSAVDNSRQAHATYGEHVAEQLRSLPTH